MGNFLLKLFKYVYKCKIEVSCKMSVFTLFLTIIACDFRSPLSCPFINTSGFKQRQGGGQFFYQTQSLHELPDNIQCSHSLRSCLAWHFAHLNVIDFVLSEAVVRNYECNGPNRETEYILQHRVTPALLREHLHMSVLLKSSFNLAF